jgi:Leucine-rich repeat (LRR) protein
MYLYLDLTPNIMRKTLIYFIFILPALFFHYSINNEYSVITKISQENKTDEISQRDILIKLYKSNPHNKLDWNLDEQNMRLWKGIHLNGQGKVKSIEIKRKGISVIPSEIGLLTDLIKLDLAGNNIKVIPSEIGQLTNLNVLDLWGNNITELPSEISQLKMLAILKLNSNQLSILPTEIGELTSLTNLELSDNKLTNLPKEMGQLNKLSILYLSNNNLTEIPIELGQLKNLTRLFLNKNKLTTIPQEVCNLKLHHGTYLSVDDNINCGE